MYLVTWCVIIKREDVNFLSQVGILEKIQKVLERFQAKSPLLKSGSSYVLEALEACPESTPSSKETQKVYATGMCHSKTKLTY